MGYFRQYEFTCVCGNHSKGSYPLTEKEWQAGIPLEEHRQRAICRTVRTANHFHFSKTKMTPYSIPETRYTGCGRSLAKSDEDYRKAVEEGRSLREAGIELNQIRGNTRLMKVAPGAEVEAGDLLTVNPKGEVEPVSKRRRRAFS